MKAELQNKIKFGIWGMVGGAAVAMIIGFSWGGWSTAGATQKVSEQAVMTSQAGICVAQYMADPNNKANLKEFTAMETYKRSDLIEQGGWDKMPGQKEANSGVSRACTNGIEALIKK